MKCRFPYVRLSQHRPPLRWATGPLPPSKYWCGFVCVPLAQQERHAPLSQTVHAIVSVVGEGPELSAVVELPALCVRRFRSPSNWLSRRKGAGVKGVWHGREGVQVCRGAGVQGCRGPGVQGCRGAAVQGGSHTAMKGKSDRLAIVQRVCCQRRSN